MENRLGRRDLKRHVLALLLAVVATTSWTLGQPAFADAEGDNGRNGSNVVWVVNDEDDSHKARGKAELARNDGPTVENSNIAVAQASCTDCRTVAVAVQVVLIEGPVDDFRPGNAAVAANANCLRCHTFAYARQEVLSPGHRILIDDDARAAMETIRYQIREVARSGAAFEDMAVGLDALTLELVAIVQGEIAETGAAAEKASHRDVKQDREDR